MSLLRVVFFPLFFLSSSFLFSHSQDLVPKNARSFHYEGDSYAQSKKWVEKVIAEAKKHDITREDIHSPHVFEIFLVKTLTSLGHETPLLDKEVLLEFMRFQMTELRHLDVMVTLLVKILTDLDRLDKFLQLRDSSLSAENYQELMKKYSVSVRRNKTSFLGVVSTLKQIRNKEDIEAFQEFLKGSASEEEKKFKKREINLLLREVLEKGYSKAFSQFKGGETLEACVHKIAFRARGIINFFTKRYTEPMKPTFKAIRSFLLLLKLARTRDLAKENFSNFTDFEFRKISSLMGKLRRHPGITYFPKKEAMILQFVLELKKSFSENFYKMPTWLEVEEDLRVLFLDLEKFFEIHFKRLEDSLVTRRGLSQEVIQIRSGR